MVQVTWLQLLLLDHVRFQRGGRARSKPKHPSRDKFLVRFDHGGRADGTDDEGMTSQSSKTSWKL